LKLLLADDHALFRQGLALLLRQIDAQLDIVHAGNVVQALSAVAQHPDLDLVLLDMALPDQPGMQALTKLHADREGLPVVALSSLDDRDTVLAAIAAGAMGFIPKSSTSEVMFAALSVVLAGGVYLPPAALLATGASGGPIAPVHASAPKAAGHQPVTTRDLGLTPRQIDVLQQVLQGKSIKSIARALGMTENTVKTHVSAVLRALHVTTRTQAVVAAGRLGLLFGKAQP